VEKLTLYNGPNSPFGRKAKITAIFHKIQLEEKIIKVQESEFLDNFNPLRKIPTLVINNNQTIIDSDNICLYFDEISSIETLFKKENYWQIMSTISVANGIMESVLERRMELIRPSNEQSKGFINKQEIRTFRTINWLEKNWDNYEKKISMDQIAIAVALEYTKFRFTDSWSKDCQKLNEWLSDFNSNDFMKLTIPKEAS
jgi:glutathione S-transferase|tara:strand:+ start:167 stop:766 length:600 start_codon:yes stop_codon:yes gene_type:complete